MCLCVMSSVQAICFHLAFIVESDNKIKCFYFNIYQNFSFQFDPAMMRFQAMRVSYTDHFKPTGKSLFHGFTILVAPLLIFGTLIYRERQERERKYRNGEVSYRDREFKFI